MNVWVAIVVVFLNTGNVETLAVTVPTRDMCHLVAKAKEIQAEKMEGWIGHRAVCLRLPMQREKEA